MFASCVRSQLAMSLLRRSMPVRFYSVMSTTSIHHTPKSLSFPKTITSHVRDMSQLTHKAKEAKKSKAIKKRAGKKYKLKTHGGCKNRLWWTADNRCMRMKAGHRHLLSKKNKAQRVRLRQKAEIPAGMYKQYKILMPYYKKYNHRVRSGN